ncbi:MAG: hypothetical protein Kow0092_05800 [Deferrisomatales bacterium]
MNTPRKTLSRPVLAAGLLLAACILSLPVPADAWRRGGEGPSVENALERLTDRLDLSAEQRDRVEEILEESFARRREMGDAHRQEREALREETDGKLAEVLTPEQMEELRDLRDRRGECWEEGRGGRRRGRPPVDQP